MLFEKKKKPITNAAELKDFKLFKDKPAPKKKNALDIDPEDIVDVDVVMKKDVKLEADATPEVVPSVEESEQKSTSEADAVDSEKEEVTASTSPFAKKNSKPSIKLGAKPEKGPVSSAEKVKKPFFSFGAASKKDESDKKGKPAPALKQKTEGGVKPYNTLSFILTAIVVAVAAGGVVLKNKASAIQSQINVVQTSITAASAEIDSVLPKIAYSIDNGKSIDVIKAITRAQLLTLPNGELSFDADATESHFYLNYYLKESADQYDFTKFIEADFPSFATGQFSTCKTNNELTKQGEKDVFAIHVKC